MRKRGRRREGLGVEMLAGREATMERREWWR
jgi:hypothetical protein